MNIIFKGSHKVIDNSVYAWHKCSEGTGTPIAVVPPHAGRGYEIGFNLAQKCIDEGRTVYIFELKSATYATANTSVDGLVLAIKAINDYIGENIQIFGMCQGGWVSFIYTCLFPERVTRLSMFATPLNTKCAPDNIIEKYMRKPFIVEYHKWLVTLQGGIQSGLLQWFSFSLIDPQETYINRFEKKRKLLDAGDTVGLAKWEHNNGWYDRIKNLGSWFTEALEHLFRDNELYDEGKWVILGRTVNPSAITCPVDTFAGKGDPITAVAQMHSIADKLTCPVTQTTFDEKTGHTTVFVGIEQLETMAQVSLR